VPNAFLPKNSILFVPTAVQKKSPSIAGAFSYLTNSIKLTAVRSYLQKNIDPMQPSLLYSNLLGLPSEHQKCRYSLYLPYTQNS
jgi:hypothetical protein